MANGDERRFSRRGFLKGAAASSGASMLYRSGAAQAAPTAVTAPTAFDFTKQSGALQPERVVHSACQFCNSLCGLRVDIKDNRVIAVHGEPEDPVQAGGLCVKAELMPQLLYNRHRLTTPMKRVAGKKGSPDSQFAPIGWDEALDLIAQKLLALRDAGDARSVVTKTTGRLPRGTGSLIGRFMALFGSPNDTDVGPVCNDAGGNALAATFGMGNFTNGYGKDDATGKEDLGAARFLLFLGTNQAETHPVTFAYLLRARQKTKARLVVVDPRLTPTGAQADEWLAPKPHTDLALALGMLHHVVARGLYDKAFVAKWVLGFAELEKHLKDHAYTPDWAAGVTGLPVEKIRGLAEGFARARPAAIFCNAGISHQMSAFQTYRALATLSAITGNVGIAGGGCNFMHNTWPGDLRLPAVSVKLPARDAALPVGPDSFSDAILSEKPYRMRALISAGGNPLLASPQSERVKEAYKRLEFYAFCGLFMEESALYADVLLPATSGLEFEGVYMRRDDRAIRWQAAAAPRIGQSRTDHEIWIDLAHAMARNDKRQGREYWAASFPLDWKDYKKLWATFVAHTPGMGGMTQERLAARRQPLRWPCPTLDHPGVSTLYLDHPSWYAAAAAISGQPAGDKTPRRFLTPSGKVELFTTALEQKLSVAGHSALPVFYTHPEVTGRHPTAEWTAEYVRNPLNPQALTRKVKVGALASGAVHEQFPLMGMIGRPSVVHFASVTHWTPTGAMMNGVRLVQLHPAVAARAGIQSGDAIVVESPRGAVTGTAQLWPGIREDTIFVPNTFGPSQKVAAELGQPLYEAANTLLSDQFYDNLSGQQAYKCFACRVRKA